ncbi:hypothetical protein BGW38_004789 [Lunasporangiospora selenospora]|uniref:Dynamin family protein n=1 Tax=Lunasporangiospora selenospora TaxID=979761 RepID=A0A9P6KBW8_9FUNG|nr:hypothetical protein BGW38_004789 [Lunasporangiospora selenospora]
MHTPSFCSYNSLDNEDYQGLIDKINKIRGFGLSKILTIPQIAILGDQSSGKSSVLEAITQLSFPRNKDTCTRFATQVNLRQSTRVEMMAFIEGEDTFNEKYRATQSVTWDIYEIVSGANDILCSGIAISEKVLEITISGPALAPLTVIDLPGYINTTLDGQDKSIIKTIHDINTKYIKDNRTIILAVVPANVDLNNMYVLGEAERYDPHHWRTVPIVTKPDTVEPDLLPSLVDILLNRRKQMKHGYLVMRNSSFKDIEMGWEESKQKEDEFFKSSPLWNQVPEERKGRVNVKNFLGELLYNHIKKELPHLKRDILDLIECGEKDIQAMGLPITSLGSAKIRYIEHILKLRGSLTSLLNGQYSFEHINDQKLQNGETTGFNGDEDDDDDDEDDEQYNSLEASKDPKTIIDEIGHSFIRSWLQKLYEGYNVSMTRDQHILPKDKIKKLVLRYKGNELPGFISFNTFTQIYSETLVQWKSITKEHVSSIHYQLHKAITEVISSTTDPRLSDLLLSEFDQFYKGQVNLIDETVQDIFDDESSPFTLNKYFYDTILSRRKAKAEKEIKNKMNELQGGRFAVHDVEQQLSSFGGVEKLANVNYNENLAILDLEEQLISYCKVARKRIVDVVLLQTIERQMIKRINRYFDKLIAVDDSAISSRLIEPPTKTTRRQELQTRVEILRKSLYEL